jgi:hypothetical protein
MALSMTLYGLQTLGLPSYSNQLSPVSVFMSPDEIAVQYDLVAI